MSLAKFLGVLLKALAQRRNFDHVGAKAVEKILTEEIAFAQGIKGTVRCSDDASTKPQRFMAADGAERAFLEDLQQLDLNWHGDVADFVEENCPVRTASSQHAFVRLDSAGESAFAMAEQFGFDERFRKLRQVERNEAAHEAFSKAPEFLIEGDVA